MLEVRSAVLCTDGSCLGNPGPAGAGYVIMDQKGNTLREGSLPIPQGTNNIAEYQAVISGMEAAAELGLTHLVVRSDSQLLCRQIWGQYKVKNSALRRMHVDVRRLMSQFAKVVFEHIPREKNERADALATAASRKAKSDRSQG